MQHAGLALLGVNHPKEWQSFCSVCQIANKGNIRYTFVAIEDEYESCSCSSAVSNDIDVDM